MNLKPLNPPLCPYFDRGECRSCGWIQLPQATQLENKEHKIQEALSFFQPVVFEPSVQSPVLGFRNRAKMVVTGSIDQPVIGLLGEAKLDEGREILACPIHHEKLNQIIAAIPSFIQGYNLIPYRILERKGELKGFIAFYSPESKQAYLRFILRSKECVERIRKLVPVFQRRFPEVVCITANIQPIPHAIQEGSGEIFLTETKEIDLHLGSVCLKLTPQAFVQTNLQVALNLYETAARWIKEARPQKVLELFSGQGAFSLVAAPSADKFLGIEINPNAVRSASESAKSLGLGHVNFKAADATQVGKEIQGFRPDLILVNPPRRGLTAGGVELLVRALPKHLLYSSCAVATLAKDLKILSEYYSLKKVKVFDMFPHTEHFETLVWLERRS